MQYFLFIFSHLYFVFAFEFLYLSLGLPCWPPEAAYGISIGGMGTPWRAKTFVPQNLNASPPDQNGLYFSHTSLKSFVSQFFVQLNSHPNDDGKSYSNKGEPDDDNDKEDDENVKKDDDIENQDDYDNENNKKITMSKKTLPLANRMITEEKKVMTTTKQITITKTTSKLQCRRKMTNRMMIRMTVTSWGVTQVMITMTKQMMTKKV